MGKIWSGHFWYTKFWVQNPLPPSPPCSKEALPLPPGGGTVTWPKKHRKYKAAKAPKLIYTVILWYSFVVQSPPAPQGGEPSLRDRRPPPWGGTVTTLVGRLQRGHCHPPPHAAPPGHESPSTVGEGHFAHSCISPATYQKRSVGQEPCGCQAATPPAEPVSPGSKDWAEAALDRPGPP